MPTIHITWDNGEVHKIKLEQLAMNQIANLIDQMSHDGLVYGRDVMSRDTKFTHIKAGDSQCGAGDSQCAPMVESVHGDASLVIENAIINIYPGVDAIYNKDI